MPGPWGGEVSTKQYPPGTATAAGGTHPTGMHSCCDIDLLRGVEIYLPYFLFRIC